MSIEATREKMRWDLHRKMRVPALFFLQAGSSPVPIFVRRHTKRAEPVGAFAGGPSGFAEVQEVQPKLLFMRAELAQAGLEPKRNSLVTISTSEAYRLDNADPIDGLSVTWHAIRLSAKESLDLPVPGETDG